MAKAFTILVITIGLCITMSVLGLSNGTTNSLLTTLGVTNSSISQTSIPDLDLVKDSTWYNSLFGTSGFILLFGGVLGAIAGFLTNRDTTTAAKSVFIGLFAGWVISDLIGIWSASKSVFIGDYIVLGYIVWAFLTVTIVAFLYSVVQVWEGSDG